VNANRIWGLGAAVVIVAVLGLGWLLGVSPLLAQAAAANQERAGVELTNQTQSATLAHMKKQFEQIDLLRDELAALRVSVPAEVDSDFVYALLSRFQEASGATVKSIVTGEAQPYGAGGTGSASGAPAPATGGVENLFTVPVTITFEGTNLGPVLHFVSEMQRGPRLFLVTAVAAGGEGEVGSGAKSTTVTAFMFVVYDPHAPRGEAARAMSEGVWRAPGAVETPMPSPTPAVSATPGPSGSPTPVP